VKTLHSISEFETFPFSPEDAALSGLEADKPSGRPNSY